MVLRDPLTEGRPGSARQTIADSVLVALRGTIGTRRVHAFGTVGRARLPIPFMPQGRLEAATAYRISHARTEVIAS